MNSDVRRLLAPYLGGDRERFPIDRDTVKRALQEGELTPTHEWVIGEWVRERVLFWYLGTNYAAIVETHASDGHTVLIDWGEA